MSRKKRLAAGAPATARAPHSAVHRRRLRGIRRSRPGPAATFREKPLTLHPVARALSDMNPAELALPACLALGGMALSLVTVGVIVHTDVLFASPYAPQIRALQLFPYLFVGHLIFGAVAPLKAAQFHIAMRSSASWTIVAGCSLACGVAMAAGPIVFAFAEQISLWTYSHFSLSDVLIRMLQIVLLTTVCLIPACGIGCILFSLFRLSHAKVASVGRRGAWCATGAGAGILLASVFGDRPSLVGLVSSLPLLLIALIAAALVLPEESKSAARPA